MSSGYILPGTFLLARTLYNRGMVCTAEGGPTMSDEELVLCAQGGNADALDELIRRWYPGIHA